MLFKMPEIQLDGKDIIKDAKLNLVKEKRQLRFKCRYYMKTKAKDVDLVLYHWSNLSLSSLSAMSISFELRGENMLNRRKINLSAVYKPFDKIINVTGSYGVDPIKFQCTDIGSFSKNLLNLL